MRLGIAITLLLLALAVAAGAAAATFKGRGIDERCYEGTATSTTYGRYECRIKFHGDRVFFRPEGSSLQIVGTLDDEAIVDAHEIVAHDPRRGVDWTLDVRDLGD